jgi:DNA/RNA-binding domain of Phe-tRNA-synthetase-like protein
MWFILESLPEMPIEALNAAADDLITGLSKMMPGAVITSELIEA